MALWQEKGLEREYRPLQADALLPGFPVNAQLGGPIGSNMKFLRLLFLRFPASWTSRGRTKAPERVPGDRVGLPYELAQGELVTRFILLREAYPQIRLPATLKCFHATSQ